MTEETDAPGLADAQNRVCQAALEAKLLVVAPAGSGKTHTAVARLLQLIGGDQLDQAEDIIALSFSRAASAELRRRARRGGLGATRISTFDSFATAVLLDVLDPSEIGYLDYDARIRRATAVLNDEDAEIPSVDGLLHVIVDEVQDLVADRSEMVIALLRRIGSGFTLFGDPAQAIYGYQEVARVDRSFLAVLERGDFGPIERIELMGSFRAISRHARQVLLFGPRIRAEDPHLVARDLRTYELGLPALQSLTGTSRMLASPQTGTTAVLARTNGQTLLLADQLWSVGVHFRLRPRADDLPTPRWIADKLLNEKDRVIPLARAATVLGDDENAQHRLVLLERLSNRRGIIDVARISSLLRARALPEELFDDPPAVTVSTIHRAKGLEFDRIIVTEFASENVSGLAEEIRVAYVALTRARDEIFTIPVPSADGGRLKLRDKRWTVSSYGGSGKVHSVEVFPGDSSMELPDLSKTDLERMHVHIASRVATGDPLMIEAPSRDGEPWKIMHEDVVVGMLTEALGVWLERCIRHERHRILGIDGLRVDCIDSVASDPAATQRAGFGRFGLHLRVRLAGLGTLIRDHDWR